MGELVSRSGWGARPWRCRTADSGYTGVTLHYTGPCVWTTSKSVGGRGIDRSSPARFRDSCDHRYCASIVRGVQAYHMDQQGWCDIAYNCVDDTTEILTENGWRSVEQLAVGDVVLTLNHETGLSEWQPVMDVNVFPAPAEMVEMRTASHSSVTTPNHRWPVERSRFRTGRVRQHGPDGRFLPAEQLPHSVTGADRLFVTTDTFGYWDRVPIAADCADLPLIAKHDDALVETVAWFWTEGTIHRLRSGKPGATVAITQARAATARCERIRSALRRTFGPPVDAMPRVGARTDGVPRWREYRNGHKAEFWLNADAGRLLQDFAPGRVPTFAFLRSLTRAQLALFIETSMLADNAGEHALAQKNRSAAEAFQFAVLLAGYGSSLCARPPTASTPYQMWQVRIRRQRHFGPRRIQQQVVAGHGVVWCPTTPNQTWLARRDGTVYFTGNSNICPHGVRYDGRGVGARSGAEGTAEGNNASFSVHYLAGIHEASGTISPLTDEAKIAFHEEADRAGVPLRWPHNRWKAKPCPGSSVIAWINAGFPLPAAASPSSSEPEPELEIPDMALILAAKDRGPILVAGNEALGLDGPSRDALRKAGVPYAIVSPAVYDRARVVYKVEAD